MQEEELKGQVRQFYDQIGWQKEAEGFYQNARYEDLRPISSEYIHRCHMRVKRHIVASGDYLLDAGSGPVQYDEYLTYSEDYRYRVCMDLSIVALKEAKKRLGEKGIYVVADIARLPFKPAVFDGIVSLHTIHHVPVEEKIGVYEGLYRCLKPGRSMVTVDGWTHVPLTGMMEFSIHAANRVRRWMGKIKSEGCDAPEPTPGTTNAEPLNNNAKEPVGTYVLKTSAKWFRKEMENRVAFKILVWRSVSVKFLRGVIHPELGGKFWLKVLYRLEELFPKFFGENGQYPIIVIEKPDTPKA
jgi:SAM-dependent methyltransferase